MSRVFANLVRSSVERSGGTVFDYAESFDRLWGSLDEGDVTAGRALVICGIDAPDRSLPDGVPWEPFAEHLHALAWAACWRLRYPQSAGRILLIGPSAWGTESLLGKLSPLGKLAILFAARDEDEIPLIGRVRWLSKTDSSPIQAWLQAKPAAEPHEGGNRFLLRDAIWNGLTGTDHHGISNVLGAFLLRYKVARFAGETSVDSSPGQDALFALFHSIAEASPAISPPAPEHPPAPPPAEGWISGELQNKIPAALLFDDMAGLWSHVVRGALGFGADELRDRLALSAPDFGAIVAGLPERLRLFCKSKRRRIAQDDLIPGASASPAGEEFVLLLDLRLFGVRDGAAEAKFFGEIITWGRQMACPPSVDATQWARFTGDLAAVEAAAANGSLRDFPPAITLLPRLLSLLDPLLPVVVFSSTHRRSLLDPLRAFPNVVTDFVKPVFTAGMGDWPTLVENTIRMFQEAMAHAAGILAARRAVLCVERRSPGRKSLLPPSDHGHLVEIFFDESGLHAARGDPPHTMCAGGVVVVRALEANGTPQVTDRSLWESLKSRGCLWGWCSDTPNDFRWPSSFMPKGGELDFRRSTRGIVTLERQLASIRQALGEHGSIFPFGLIAETTDSVPPWMLAPNAPAKVIESTFDQTLRNLIHDAIEGLIFRDVTVVQALSHRASKMDIDLAERDYPARFNHALFDAFGIRPNNCDRLYTILSNDGYPITSEVCARLGIPWPHKARIRRARAVPLPDFAGKFNSTGLLPKQLHYFADTIAHVALHDRSAATARSSSIREFFDSGWFVDYRLDDTDRQLLKIARKWDQGDRISALREAARLKDTLRKGVGADLDRSLSEKTSSLQPHEIADLIARFRTDAPAACPI